MKNKTLEALSKKHLQLLIDLAYKAFLKRAASDSELQDSYMQTLSGDTVKICLTTIRNSINFDELNYTSPLPNETFGLQFDAIRSSDTFKTLQESRRSSKEAAKTSAVHQTSLIINQISFVVPESLGGISFSRTRRSVLLSKTSILQSA